MLKTTLNAKEKRQRFRAGLLSGRLQRFPGAFAPLVAMLIEELGFEGVYVSGAALAADLGLPDIGLTTLTEVGNRGHQIACMTNLPCFIDADTGFGEAMNAARTIRRFEDLGLAACHIEDQIGAKRCGHLDHKSVIPREQMGDKLRAAVTARRDPDFVICARTDARTVEGLDAAIDRAKSYLDAGADMIFPEALQGEREFEIFRHQIKAPILANMTEFGKSKLLTVSTLQDIGVNLVIYPVTTLRLAMAAVEDGLKVLLAEGTQENLLNKMQHRKRLYELLGYEGYNVLDPGAHDFPV